MKIFSCLLPALLGIASFANADESKASTKTKPQKIYVDPSTVQVAEEGILVNLQEQVVLVKNLRSDRRGVFVLDTEIAAVEKNKVFRCGNCGGYFAGYHKCKIRK